MAENLKRARDEEGGELVDSPEEKRIRADFLFEIFDDESEPDMIPDLDSVMRSFEEEIATFPSPDFVPDPPKLTDLGFLLEASDDEIGLPPPGSECDFKAVFGGQIDDVTSAQPAGFEKIWGFVDEFHLDFVLGSEERDNGGEDAGVILDEGLFDFSDGIRGSGEFSELTCQSEYLPAL